MANSATPIRSIPFHCRSSRWGPGPRRLSRRSPSPGRHWSCLLADRSSGSEGVSKLLMSRRGQDRFAKTVITVRRGVDYLSLRSDIDQTRGAIVGFSFGAWIGSIVAAVDTRRMGAVLIALVPRMSEFWRASSHPEVLHLREGLQPGIMDNYAERSKWLDASEYLQRRSNVPLFFQFGAGDEVISQEYVREFTLYACGTNQLKVYESGPHYEMFFNSEARRDRLFWLRHQLFLGQWGTRH
jgi:cephalosporin-C deacetylase-like acetyl esterase